jgi:hypothetical protein
MKSVMNRTGKEVDYHEEEEESEEDSSDDQHDRTAEEKTSLSLLVRYLLSIDSSTVIKSLSMLLSLDLQQQPENKKLRVNAVNYGICLSIVVAMENHQNCSTVQEDGIGLMDCLTIKDAVNYGVIVGHGGIRCIVLAMTSFPGERDLQYNALVVFDNLLCRETTGKIIMDEGGLPVILSALANHRQAADIQKWACYALTRLAESDQAVRTQTFENGGLSSVAKCAEFHSGDAELLEAVKDAMDAFF